MKAVVYCRVSTEEQVANLSLGTQERACRDYCARQGWNVDRVFVERGESAKTVDRAELQAALDYCRRHRTAVDLFVVYAADRLARQQHDHHALRHVLGRLGIGLRSATQPIDDTPEGQLFGGVLASLAQYDNDLRARRTRDGMRAALEAGRWVWQPPVGYRTRHEPGSGRHLGIEPDPDTAPLVLRAFQAVAAGAQVAAVAAELQAEGLRGQRGQRIAVQTLHSILRNDLYRGWISAPRWGIERQAQHEALVDAATWARVQRRIDPTPEAPTRAYRRLNPDFILAGGFLRCAACDRPLTGSWAKGRSQHFPYYRCFRCGLQARRETVEGAFVDTLRLLQPSSGRYEAFRALVVEEYHAAAGEQIARADRARKRLEAAEARRQRLIDAYLDQAIELTDYRVRLDQLHREIAEAELEAAQATDETLPLDELLNFVGATLARPADTWADADAEHRRRLAVGIFPAGATYGDGEIPTALTCSLFNVLGTAASAGSHGVPPTGRRSNRSRRKPGRARSLVFAGDAAALLEELAAFRAAWTAGKQIAP